MCEAGTYYAGGCVDGLDTFCLACTKCPEGSFASSGCDGVEDSVCSPCTEKCPDGLFPAKACTSDNDLVCSPCRPCPSGTITAQECDSETESICLGLVTMPELPSVLVEQESRVLRIELGIRTPDELQIVMRGLGLQVIQGDRTNYDASMTDFAEKEQSFAVQFLRDDEAASITIVPHALGRNPVNFTIQGKAAPNFVSLTDMKRIVYGLSRKTLRANGEAQKFEKKTSGMGEPLMGD